MFRLLRSGPFRCLTGLSRSFSSSSAFPLPSSNTSKLSTPFISSPLSSKPEGSNLNHLSRGVVVRSLPKDLDEKSLISELKSTFSPSFVEVKLDIQNKPAFAILRFNDEESVNRALSLHKTSISGKKVYVCTINQFIASSPTIGSGHDSRRLVLYNLPTNWTAQEVYENFSIVGNIMKCSIPKDYTMGTLIMNDQKCFNEILGPQKINLSRVSGLASDSPNVFQDFRTFLMKEFDKVRFLMYFKGNNSKQVFQGLAFIWEKLRKFKDVFAIEPNEEEEEINQLLNNLSGLSSKDSLREDLAKVYSKIFQDFNNTLDNFFSSKGFARVEFATREQAERAISCSEALSLGREGIQAIFDRNLPDYFFTSEFLAEALVREKEISNFTGFSVKEAEIKLNHHFLSLNQEMIKKSQFEPILNFSNYSDPLISQQARTPNEAKDIIAGIEGIHPFGFEKRAKKLKPFPVNSKVSRYSSDDDFFSKPGLEDKTFAFDKLQDERHEYTKMLNKQFIMFPEKIPVRKEEVKTYQIVPDMEFPSEMPPRKLWSNNGEKTMAYETILSYSQFFHEKIPNTVAKDPALLQKEKFGDFPFIRHVFEPREDYNHLSKHAKSLWKRNEIIQNIRKKIRNFSGDEEDEEDESEFLRYVELGSEEYQLLKNQENQRMNTDSELEEESKIKAEKVDLKKIVETSNEKKKVLEKLFERIETIGIPPPNMIHSKAFKYEGDQDIDEYIKDLKSNKGIYAEWKPNNSGEKIVYVECKNEDQLDIKETEKLVKKYGDMIINAEDDEIEIDKEDINKMKRLKDFDFDPDELFKMMIHHYAYEMSEEAFREHSSTKPIEIYGHLTPMVQEYEEMMKSVNHLETYFDNITEDESN